MSRIPWLWNILSQYWLEIETSFCFFLACENIRFSSLFTEEKRMFSQASFFPTPWARQRSPKIIVRDNFGTKKTNLLLWWWRYTHTLNRFSRSGISTFRHWSQGLANKTWSPKCHNLRSKHPFLLALRRWGRFARPQRRRARRNGCFRRLLFSFRVENYTPAGMAKRKKSLMQTFYETSAAHFFDWLTFAESANQNYFRCLFF